MSDRTAGRCSSACASCPAVASCSSSPPRARTSSWSAAPCATCCSAATPRELDVVVDGDARGVRRAIVSSDARWPSRRRTGVRCRRAGARALRHRASCAGAAGGSTWRRRRAESYAAPGALPDVRAGHARGGSARRDFTVNAIAVALGGARAGELRAAPHALEDLARARLRVLHERQLPRRPDAPAAPGALPRAAGLRARASTPPSWPREAIAAGALAHGLARAHRRRAAPGARRARPGGALGVAAASSACSSRCTRRSRSTSRSRARRSRRLPASATRGRTCCCSRRCCCPGTATTRPTTRRACACCSTASSSLRPSASARCTARSSRRRVAERLQQAQTPVADLRDVAHDAPLEALALAAALAEAERARRRPPTQRAAGCRAAPRAPADHRRRPAAPPASPPGRRSAGACERALLRKLDGELRRATARPSWTPRWRSREHAAQASAIDAGRREGFSCELPGGARALFTSRAHGNLSTQRGDGHEHGRAARERLCEDLGLQWLCASRQVHGSGGAARARRRRERGSRRSRSTPTVTPRRCRRSARWC